jgi:acetyl esterase/lipase
MLISTAEVRLHYVGKYTFLQPDQLINPPGWGLGDLDTESHICKHICIKADICVIDVDYRLVPEHAFPIGIQDSFAALQYIHAQGAQTFKIDPARISLGGVSAGGNIALVCAHLARDANIPLKLVAVGTPTVDDISKYKTASEAPWPSMHDMEHAPTLNWARLKWFDKLKWQSIAPGGPERDSQLAAVKWYANILDAPVFTNLSKTVIYTAGCDPLRDEGEAYAQKLIAGGNEVIQKRFAGVPHPFMHMDKGQCFAPYQLFRSLSIYKTLNLILDLWQAKEFIDLTAGHIRATLGSDSEHIF